MDLENGKRIYDLVFLIGATSIMAMLAYATVRATQALDKKAASEEKASTLAKTIFQAPETPASPSEPNQIR